jgi:hypothetical protein
MLRRDARADPRELVLAISVMALPRLAKCALAPSHPLFPPSHRAPFVHRVQRRASFPHCRGGLYRDVTSEDR